METLFSVSVVLHLGKDIIAWIGNKMKTTPEGTPAFITLSNKNLKLLACCFATSYES